VEGHDLEIIPTLTGKFDFVYIDTTHRYEHTVAEIEAARAHSPGAVLALHDVLSCPGVAQAIERFASNYEVTILPTPPHPTLGWINGLAILRPKPSTAVPK
jgi:predicted O-methyltransferase YrrM